MKSLQIFLEWKGDKDAIEYCLKTHYVFGNWRELLIVIFERLWLDGYMYQNILESILNSPSEIV